MRTRKKNSAAALAAIGIAIALAPSGARAQDGPALTPERIEAALRRYRHEPSAMEVVRAALATRTADPARAHDAIDRARLSGLLPTARARLRRGQAIDLRGITGVPTDANVSTGDDLMVEGSLVFRLDRLVFAPDEGRLLSELRALEQARTEIVRAVIALYYERRRLQLERDLLGRRDLATALRILEIEALLDGFTGGAFTRMMNARERDPSEP
ncbi:MAG TPA: hypothetical protein VIL20_13325 [Sandaracinaceae bacterium]